MIQINILIKYLLVFILFLLYNASQPVYPQSKKLQPGDKAPAICINRYIGNAPSKDLLKKPLLLDFWATWCGPCIAGLAISNEWVPKYVNQIDFIAITEEEPAVVATFLKKRKFNHFFAIDSNHQTNSNFNITGIPHSLLIDRNGIIQWEGNTHDLSEKTIVEFLKTGKVVKKAVLQQTKSIVQSNNDDTLFYHQDDDRFVILKKDYLPLGVSDNYTIISSDSAYQVGFNRIRLGDLINQLTDRPSVYYETDVSLKQRLLQVTGMFYKSNSIGMMPSKQYLVKVIEDCFNISIDTIKQQKEVYILTIEDTSKYKKHISISNEKEEGYGKPTSSDRDAMKRYYYGIGNTPDFLCTTLQKYMQIFIQDETGNKQQTDYIKLPIYDIKKMVFVLQHKYGIKVIKRTRWLDIISIKPKAD
jgi:thiol-disulfide isomerase/thioredoxin